jgi:putative FmdB family regulatory protein
LGFPFRIKGLAMPIYAYRCESCGHAKDVLQKMSDQPLSTCPSCGAEAYKKQVTAAGFQLKGSGWYVTDFRGGDTGKAAKTAGAEGAADSGKDARPAADKKSDAPSDAASAAAAQPAAASASTSAAATPAAAAPAAKPAGPPATGGA